MFVAMNQFSVAEGQEEQFERTWRERKSYLESVPGFVQFALLRGDGEREYVSHSTWRDRDAFVAWTQSEAFVAGHRQGSLMGVLEGPPHLKTFEAIIVETPEGRTVATQ
ncbi:MAG: antibiotic biosynthesis monooxygenase [Dehalococcoidia bacterium]|nr:antibiotic biosynthesis monooxygenase [Dehalococcoidia bacterium]